MEIRSVQPKVIHVIGDSHALAFKRKNIELSELGMIFSTSVCYMRGVQPSTITPNGQLNPLLAQYLVKETLITPDGMPIALTDESAILSEQYATGTGFQSELVVFHIGEIYVRKYLGALDLAETIDQEKIDSDFRLVIESYINSVKGIATSFGLASVVHEVCPPTADDSQFEKINGVACTNEFRGAIYRKFNELLIQCASNNKVMFCRSNDYLADKHGCLKPDYDFDGVHADPKYTSISLGRIAHQWLYSRSADRTLRYKKWVERLSGQKGSPPISQMGVSKVFQVLDDGQVATLQASFSQFENHVCNKPKADWAHAPPFSDYPKFNPLIKYGAVDHDGLRLLHNVFVKGSIGDTIRSLVGSKFSIINVRPVESAVHDGDGVGPQSFHRDHCPAGIFRGLLYLVDVADGDGAFEYEATDGSGAKQVQGPAGSLVIFDANAVQHRATPPRTRTRLALDFIILVVPDEVEEIVHNADVGDVWPLDPYVFDLTERCFPAIESGRWFYPSLLTSNA